MFLCAWLREWVAERPDKGKTRRVFVGQTTYPDANAFFFPRFDKWTNAVSYCGCHPSRARNCARDTYPEAEQAFSSLEYKRMKPNSRYNSITLFEFHTVNKGFRQSKKLDHITLSRSSSMPRMYPPRGNRSFFLNENIPSRKVPDMDEGLSSCTIQGLAG